MRRFLSKTSKLPGSGGWFRKAAAAGALGAAVLALAGAAKAQEIQITGPLAGAPAVRKLRLHREGRFEIAPSVSFTLLDQYQRTIMPGARAQYHFTDWIGVGIWGGYGFQYTTALTDELQEKAVDARACHVNPGAKACRLTEVSLTRKGVGTGSMADDQLGKLQWVVAPQVTFVPFRGKLAFLSALFVDTDVSIFAGPAIVGLQERAACGFDDDGGALTPCSQSFQLESRVTVAPTFGLGLNFYPGSWIGFGAEWRGLPFSWNTSGFDNHGAGDDEDFPDTAVNGKDREFHFNSMLTVYVSFQLPTKIKMSE